MIFLQFHMPAVSVFLSGASSSECRLQQLLDMNVAHMFSENGWNSFFFFNEKAGHEYFSTYSHTFGIYSCGAGLGLAALFHSRLFFFFFKLS